MSRALLATLPETLDRRYGPTRTLLLFTAFAFLVLNVVAYPYPLEGILAGPPHRALTFSRYANSFLPLSLDPFNAHTPLEPQFRLRILAPLIAWLLHLKNPYAALVAYLCSLPAIYATAWLLRKYLSPTLTLLALLLLTLNLPFIISNVWIGYPDALAALFLLLAMACRSPWATIPFLFLAMLTEERSVLAGGILLCWWIYRDSRENLPLPQIRRRTYHFLFAGLATFALWLLYAHLLLAHLHLSWSEYISPGLVTLDLTIPRAPYILFFTYRAAWLLPFTAVSLAFRHKPHRNLALAFLLSCIPLFLSAFKVYDTNRVMALTLPAFIPTLIYLHDQIPEKLPSLLRTLLAIDLLCPVVVGFFALPYHIQSTPIVALLHLLHYPYRP